MLVVDKRIHLDSRIGIKNFPGDFNKVTFDDKTAGKSRQNQLRFA